jgi:hypothetical protein
MAGFAPKNIRSAASGPIPITIGDSCDLRFNLDLVGVRAEVLGDLRIGNTLLVRIVDNGKMRSVTCVATGNKIVGTLAAFRGLAQLIACIEKGAVYLAHIDFVSSSRCSVAVFRT